MSSVNTVLATPATYVFGRTSPIFWFLQAQQLCQPTLFEGHMKFVGSTDDTTPARLWPLGLKAELPYLPRC